MSQHTLLTLPIGIPLVTFALTLLLQSRPAAQRAASLGGSIALLVSALALVVTVFDGTILATTFGGWAAPFGIVFVGDLLSAAMVLITGVMAVAVSVYGLAGGTHERERALFHPLYHGLLLGVTGAFLTGDLFNLYVWFEIMLVSSFGLLAIDGTKQQLDGAIKYVVLNLVATTVLLMSIGFLYGLTGTLNMADLAAKVPSVENQGLVTVVAVLFLISFGSKAAVFPLFFWLPASYHTAIAPVMAIFAALLTKVGVYAALRIFTLIFTTDVDFLGPAIAWIAATTMVVGVLGAASHYDVRRILSFHIISQIGYMFIGLAVATRLAMAGSILYVIHHIVVKANLFLIAGAVRRAGGSYDLLRTGGLVRSAPLLAMLFAVPALSLAGLPPMSGFWAKLVVIRSSLEAGEVALAVVALVVGLLTLYSMVKIWNETFWKSPPDASRSEQSAARWRGSSTERRLMLAPIAVLAGITLLIGLWTEPFVDYSLRAADQLLDARNYIDAVRSGGAE